jgi:carboxypeptidase PM20D1
VRNTISITGIKGSDKVNVIPAEAHAEIDARLLPGEDPQAFVETIRKIIADDSIKIEVILSFPAAISSPHPEATKAISELARKNDGNIPILAPLVSGFTDCHFFRERKIPCFGFLPIRSSASAESLVHGNNERLSVDSFSSAIGAMFELVERLTAE